MNLGLVYAPPIFWVKSARLAILVQSSYNPTDPPPPPPTASENIFNQVCRDQTIVFEHQEAGVALNKVRISSLNQIFPIPKFAFRLICCEGH